MHPRLWLASAAVAVAATGALVVSPIVHGQDRQTPPATTDTDTTPNPDRLAREISDAVRGALEQSGLTDGRLSADMRRAAQEAARSAQEAVRDLDVDVLVDDAMQGFGELSLLGGRPRIGVSTRDVTAEEAKTAGLTGITGAYVTEVDAESAAGKAGLQARDIITAVDGETIRSARHLARVIVETPEGRALQVAYVRGTAKNTAAVTPEVRSLTRRRTPGPGGEDGPMVRRFERRFGPGNDPFEFAVPGGPDGDGPRQFFFRGRPEGGARIWVGGRGRLGVMVQPVSEQLATYFGVTQGVLVSQVNENSPAAKAGIKAGDVLTAVNGKPVKDTGDIFESLEGVEDGKAVPVELTRDRKSQTLTVTLAPRSDTSGDRPTIRRQRFTA